MSFYSLLAYVAIAYYLILYSFHLLYLVIGYKAAVRWKKMGYLEEAHRLSRSVIVPPLTLVIDLDSTMGDVVGWVDHVLSQRFPELEIMVLFNEEGGEGTADLIETYYLRRVDRVYKRVIEAPRALEIYQSDDRRLTLVKTENVAGGDSLNLALNLARYPLIGVAYGGPYLEDDALLCMVRPFMEGDISVPAVMGVELPLEMKWDGLLPPRRITRFAFMESLRVQLGYMVGAPYLGGPVVAYSSLILYRKRDLQKAGGFIAYLDYVGAEMNMTVRLHRLMHEEKKKYRFVFLPQLILHRLFPRSWREHIDEYGKRRKGISAALWSETDMLFKARYGRFGMIDLPFFWLFVNMAPVVGFAAFAISIFFFALGLVGWPVFTAFLASSMLYPALVGVGAVAAARRELGTLKGQGVFLYGYAFITQFWFRQLTALAPILGFFKREGRAG
jgi:cellulose synthase/poly-beta-1,6-N-acetylglucosamine synthase-like glycosyltransferase